MLTEIHVRFLHVFLAFLQAPKPRSGPHKQRECLPLVLFLRNRLKYALNNDEVKKILNQRFVKVDGQIRTDPKYPAGFMGRFNSNELQC